MKNKIKKYALAAAAISLAALLLVFIATRPKAPSEAEPTDAPPVRPSLRILSVSPTPPIIDSMWATEPIVVKFNKPLAEGSISYTIDPETKSKLDHSKSFPDTFKITPQDGWVEETTYTITINGNSLISTSGDTIADDIQIQFKRISNPSSFLEPNTDEPFIERY